MGLLLLSWLSGWALVAGACALVGLSFGGLLPVSSSLMARVFGREQVGPKMGVALPLTSAVQLPGPIVMARIFDETGSYDLGFYGLAVLLLAAACMVRWVRVLPQGRV